MSQSSCPASESPVTSGELKCPYLLSKTLLGTGSYANVYECRRIETKVHYAAKRFSKKQVYGLELMLQREFTVLKKILRGHPNILLMVDYFETSEYFFLVTNLANGGELYERITSAPQGKLSVADTQEIIRVLLSSLSYLHANGVVHRDVKAENILFKSRTSLPKLLLLADFGHAQILGPGEMVYTLDGTLSYLAPEVLLRKGHSFPVDMWAVGALTYFMLCGYMPFDCDSDSETRALIAAADYVFEPEEYWAPIPDLAKDFLAKCFLLDVSERLTADAALNHPFLRGERQLTKGGFSQESLTKLHDSMLKLQQSRQKSVGNLLSLPSSVKLPRLQSGTNLSMSRTSLLVSRNSLLMSRNNLLTRLSRPSFLDLSMLLNGKKCVSPDAVSTLSTPVMSASSSRHQSMTSVMSAAGDTPGRDPVKLPVLNSRTGMAKFVL